MRHKNSCPWCGAPSTVAHGKSHNGRSRRLCKACGKTFSDTTGTVFFSRKLPADKLRKMANLMINDTKLKAISDSVGISSKTAYIWRMKIYTAAYEMQKSAMLSGEVWIDEKLIPVNGRLEFRFAGGKKPRGVSRNQICVACAVDSAGNRYAEVAGRGHISSAQCLRTYGRHIAKGASIVHDGIFSHDRLIAFLGAESMVYKSVTRESHRMLQPVNSFIAEIERHITVHTGIRTEYLGLYCAWIAFKASITGANITEKIDELIRICCEIDATFKEKSRY